MPATSPREAIEIYPTRSYWLALLASLLFLLIALWFNATYLPLVAIWIRYATIALALVVVGFALIGLIRRYRLIHRSAHALKRSAHNVVEGVRAKRDAHEGALERFAARLGRLFHHVGRILVILVRLPIRLLIWAYFTGEVIWWWIILILYDVLYYPTYAAWRLTHFAVRVALWITVFALRIAWKILRIPTRLPGIRKWWREKKRPEILAWWRGLVAGYERRRALRIEKGRRLAALRGENPDRWEADHRIRRGFPLPHPEKGRVVIRRRIARVREIQKARREGRPIPRRPPKRGEESPAEGEALASTPESEASPAESEANPRRLHGLTKRGGEGEPAAEP